MRTDGSVGANRFGFTLVETLVVIAVVGLVAGMVLAAVSVARESSRRIECMNRLKQIGEALQARESSYHAFPPPMPPRFPRQRPIVAADDYLSGYYELLPHLEQSSLHNAINIDLPVAHPGNQTAFLTTVSQFLCPSESHERAGSSSPNSFRFNVGNSNPTNSARSSTLPGAFDCTKPVPAAAFRDGLSSTVGFSERNLGSLSADRFDFRRDIRGVDLNGLFDLTTDDQTLKACRALQEPPKTLEVFSDVGLTWMYGGNPYVWYNHVAPPNERSPDCSTGPADSEAPLYCITCSQAARSWHNGGVNCLFMDGSVRHMRSAVDLSVWRALGSRSGGEAVSSGW